MKFFLILILLSTLILALGKPFGPGITTSGAQKARKTQNPLWTPVGNALLESFEKPRNARVFQAFLTGEKNGISPKLKNQFDELELGFLFSPSGLHLSGFFLLFFFLLRKIASRKTISRIKLVLTCLCYALPFLSLKRLVIFRLLFLLNRKCSLRWRLEHLFLFTFALAFVLGHYQASPSGFIMSFLFMGTFLSLRDEPRLRLILGLFCSHLLLSAFNGNAVSLPALFLGIPLISLFTGLMALSGFYLLSYRIWSFNWIEPLVALYIWLVKKGALIVKGTHIHASIFLLMGLIVFLAKKDKRALIFLLVFHAGTANSPAFFVSGSWTREHTQSAGKRLYYSERRASARS